jgi:predicted aldo/keto reductase-like oxidoreductase
MPPTAAPPAMVYRRFGKTNLQMPVLSCGGMRYQQAWQDIEATDLDQAGQDNLEATIRRALELGINHIETARGYGSSEYQLGRILPLLPREPMIVQTKICPTASADEFLQTFEVSMGHLKLDYVDLLSIHGINTMELLDQTLHGGTLAAARQLQAEGRVRHIGFSTHGDPEVVQAAVESDAFSYVNLHWYYFDQRNWGAVAAAAARDMGVFIISPSDKGGHLHTPSPRLTELCAPLTPMGFNDLFCLSRPEVHTLSIGAARPSDFDAHMEILPLLSEASTLIEPVADRLVAAMRTAVGADFADQWQQGLPAREETPGNVPLYHIIRLYIMAKALGTTAFAKARYNLLGNADHWFPGNRLDKLDWDALAPLLGDYPFRDQLPALFEEFHTTFNAEPEKRLSESE